MQLKSTRTLGLAFYDQAILLAELRGSGDQPSLSRAARFELGQDQQLDEPEKLGAALKRFLHEQGFKAKRCVVGLPARWVMSKMQQVPPAAGEALTGLVRLKAEVAFASDARELAVDYLPPLSAASASAKAKTITDELQNKADHADAVPAEVLLLATLRRRVEQVQTLTRVAGLRLVAVTATPAVLAMADPQADDHGVLTLHLSQEAAELSLQRGGQVCMIRPLDHDILPDQPDSGERLLRDMRRLAQAHADQIEGTRLRLWDSLGVSDQLADSLRCALAVKRMDRGRLEDLAHPNGVLKQTRQVNVFGPATALARSVGQPRLRPIDFLHSRLAAKPTGRWSRPWRIGAVAAAVLILLLGAGVFHYQSIHGQVTALETQYRQMQPQLRAAQAVVQQVRVARGWSDLRTPVLDVLHDLTMQYPQRGRIWVTDLTLREDLEVFVTGRAEDDRAVLDLLDRLQGSPSFDQVKLQFMREAERGQREVAYAIVFRYQQGGQD